MRMRTKNLVALTKERVYTCLFIIIMYIHKTIAYIYICTYLITCIHVYVRVCPLPICSVYIIMLFIMRFLRTPPPNDSGQCPLSISPRVITWPKPVKIVTLCTRIRSTGHTRTHPFTYTFFNVYYVVISTHTHMRTTVVWIFLNNISSYVPARFRVTTATTTIITTRTIITITIIGLWYNERVCFSTGEKKYYDATLYFKK